MMREHEENAHGTIALEFQNALEKLEFGTVLDILAGHAVGERTAEGLRSTAMLGSVELIELSQSTIMEARGLLERAYVHAEASGYLCHEFGDSSLILGPTHRARRAGRSKRLVSPRRSKAS